jgi:hypothetical protein
MTTMTQTRRPSPTVGTVLATMHERGMKEVAVSLAPALSETADFWTRWSAARFLRDQFDDRFHLECALVDALARFLPGETVDTLAELRADLERTAGDLIDAGRRRGTRILTAQLARRLIDQLALWCVEVELATSRIGIGDLPLGARRLLVHLRTADALSR